MNIAICDDERCFRDAVHDLLREYNRNYDLYVFENGKSLLDSGYDFDIVFLDISMPEMGGMEVATRLRKLCSRAIIIFLTSYSEYVYDAFKVDAFRFLVKPINKKDFTEAIGEAEKQLTKQKKVIVRRAGETHEINIEDILFFEGYGDGTYIYLADSSVLDSGLSLKEWEERMCNFGFYRINRNHLIAFSKILSFSGTNVLLKSQPKPFTISRRNTADFKKAYMQYIKNHSHIV